MIGFGLHEKWREGRLYTAQITLFFIAAAFLLLVDALHRAGHWETRAVFCPQWKCKIFFFSLLNYEIPFQRKEKYSHQLICFSSFDSWFLRPLPFQYFEIKDYFKLKNIKTCHSNPVNFQNTAFFACKVKLSNQYHFCMLHMQKHKISPNRHPPM